MLITGLSSGFSGTGRLGVDYFPVKSFDEAGIAKAKSLIRAGRHYTFFTLVSAALFELGALKASEELQEPGDTDED